MGYRDIETKVLSKVRMHKEDLEKVERLAESLCKRAEAIAREKGVDVEAMVVGSLAKGTFMAGVDIDIFLLFPPETPREKLESVGLYIGHSMIGGEERYAEHPYVHGVTEGYDIDIVPCYKVSSTSDKMSAVDRTPFHTRFVLENMTEEERGQVLLLKRFMKGVGVYGAEARIGGFSGYLCELLVLRFGTFRGVLEAADKWSEKIVLSLGDGGSRRFVEPLAFVDPVDSSRNVAAAVTKHSLGVFVHACREYMQSPSISFFFSAKPEEITLEEALKRIEKRETYPLLLSIKKPDVVDDVFYPQLHKLKRTIQERLAKEGFPYVFAVADVVENNVLLFMELEQGTRPRVFLHRGPPVWSQNADKFLEKWSEKGLSPPYICDGFWVVDASRDITTAEELLEKGLMEWSIGKDIASMVADGEMSVYSGGTALENTGEYILSIVFDKRMPWEREAT